MKIKWPDIQWLAVLVGVAVIFLVTVQIKSFIQIDKSRFDLNQFGGTNLAFERDDKRYFTTFAHAGVLELTQSSIGLPDKNPYRANGPDSRATIPLETLYFSSNDLKVGGKLFEFSVYPITDRLFVNGIQNFTRIKMVDIQPERDAWMIGARANISGIVRRIISISVDELIVEGLLNELPPSNSIQISLRTRRTSPGSTHGITLTAYSDTVFWQNGVWVFDDRAFLFGSKVDDIQPGDSLIFQDGSARVVNFIRSNGVIELEGGRLDPNLHGRGTKIVLKQTKREARDVKQWFNFLPVSDADFYKGINRYQRVLVSLTAKADIAANDYVMFSDGILRRIYRIGEGYIDVDLLEHPSASSGETNRERMTVEMNMDLSSKKNINQVGYSPRRLPSLLPLNSRTFITGNRFLHVPREYVDPGSPNITLAQAYRKRYLSVASSATSPKIWATYTGIVNLLYDSVHPINRDYLIHVLGSSERRKYVEEFVRAQPDFVQTSVDNFDNSNFHSWSLNTSWNFYEQMLLNYTPVYSYDYMAMWQRRPEVWLRNLSTSAAVIGNSLPAKLLPSSPKLKCEFELFTVTVEYEVNNPWKAIPVFGRTDRYLINKKGAENTLPVPLPPDERRWSFPVLRRAGAPVELMLDEIHPIANFSKISIKHISASKLPLAQESIRKMFFPTYFSEEIICNRKLF